MGHTLHALRYMTRFRCIAEACEDSCCTGMKILLTPGNHARLREAMTQTTEMQQEWTARIQEPAELPSGFESVIAMHEDGTCSFLEADRRCSVWKRFGEATLPDACSLFPRVFSHLPERVEVSATLACPEAARLCLLAPDSVELVEAPPTIAERIPPATPSAEPPPYVFYVEEVREVGLELLRSARHPLPARLSMLAELGGRTAPFFHEGTAAFEGELRPAAEARLREELTRSLSPEEQEASSRRLAAVPARGSAVVQTLVGLLTSLKPTGSVRYNQLVTAILNRYLTEAATEPLAGKPGGPSLWEVLWRAYQTKRARLIGAPERLVADCCIRYCINEWHREWYTHSPDLLAHAFKLALRLFGLRFLVAGHPAIEALLEYRSRKEAPEELAESERTLLERAVVEVFQIFTKQVERDPQIMVLLERHLTPESLGVGALGRTMMFLQAC